MAKVTSEIRDAVVRGYEQGKYIYQIAEICKISSSEINRILKDAGVKMRGRGCPKGIKKNVVYGRMESDA